MAIRKKVAPRPNSLGSHGRFHFFLHTIVEEENLLSSKGAREMAKKAASPNKSEAIRQLLKANPKMKAKEIVSTLSAEGVNATEALVYFVKGKLRGRKARKRRVSKKAAKVAEKVAKVGVTTNGLDALSVILKVKKLASEVGGMGKLQAMVEALGQ
jgi:hypothetical protein